MVRRIGNLILCIFLGLLSVFAFSNIGLMIHQIFFGKWPRSYWGDAMAILPMLIVSLIFGVLLLIGALETARKVYGAGGE